MSRLTEQALRVVLAGDRFFARATSMGDEPTTKLAEDLETEIELLAKLVCRGSE